MKTVKEVSELTGVSIRTLRYYDEIGLLKPTTVTAAGYRLYDYPALERLQQVLFLRELEIPLDGIAAILDDPHYDRRQALLKQKALLEQKCRRLNGIVELITDVIEGGGDLDFSAFSEEDTQKILDHILGVHSEDSLHAIRHAFGSTEAFKDAVAGQLEEGSAHYDHLYGGRKKAVEAILRPPLSPEEVQDIKEENDETFRLFAAARSAGDEAMARQAVARYAATCKRMLGLDNARYLLLKIAEDYLERRTSPELIQATEHTYGRGITRYIGLAIRQYYGVAPQ